MLSHGVWSNIKARGEIVVFIDCAVTAVRCWSAGEDFTGVCVARGKTALTPDTQQRQESINLCA